MNTNIKIIYMIFKLYLISICNGVQEIQEITSDENYLRKCSVDLEESSGDDNLFNTTLKFLERLCVCLNETLKKSDSTVFEDDSYSQKFLESHDVYQNINNNTCLDIQDNILRKINEIKDVDNGKENNNLLEDITNDNITEFEDVLYTSLIKTQNLHTYVINEYSIAKKASALDVQDHSTIVILTIYDSLLKSKSLTNRTITKLEIYNLFFKNSTTYIDIIGAKSNMQSSDKTAQNKPFVAQLCNLYSIYTTLIKSKNDKNLKNYKILQRNGFMKIYIEVINIKNQDKITKLCCKDNNSMEICKKPFGMEIKNIENFVSQKKETTKMYRSIIRRIKNLIKQYFGKFHNENECNVLDGDSNVFAKNKTPLNLIESTTITHKENCAINKKYIYAKRKPEKGNKLKSVLTSINHILNNKRIIPLMQAPSHQNNEEKVMNHFLSNLDLEKDSGEPHINGTTLKTSKTIDIKDTTNKIIYSSAVTEVIRSTESQSSESKDIEFDTVLKSMSEEPIKESIQKVNMDLSTTLSDLLTTLNHATANTTNFGSDVNNLLKTNKAYVTTGNNFDYIHQVIDKRTTSGFEPITSSNLYLQSTKKPNLRGVNKKTVLDQYIKLYAKIKNSTELNINKTTQKIPKIADIKVVKDHILYSTVSPESTSSSDMLLESEDIEFKNILKDLSEKTKESIENFDKNVGYSLLTTQEISSTTNKFDYIQQMQDKKLKTSFKSLNTLPNKLYLQSTDRLTTLDTVRNYSKENLSSKYLKAYTKENLRENLIYTNNNNEDMLQFNINTITKSQPYILKYLNQIIEPHQTIVDQTFENVGLTIKTDKTIRFPPHFDTSPSARYTENVINTFGQLEISPMTEAIIRENAIQPNSLLPLTKNPIIYTEKTVFLKNNNKKFKHTTATTRNGFLSKNAAPKVNEKLLSHYVDIYKTTLSQYTQNKLNLLGYINISTNIFGKSLEAITILNNNDLSFTVQPITVTSMISEREGLQKRKRYTNSAPTVSLSPEEPPIITQTYVERPPFLNIVRNLNEEKQVLQKNKETKNSLMNIFESTTAAITFLNNKDQSFTIHKNNIVSIVSEKADRFTKKDLPIITVNRRDPSISTQAYYTEMYPFIDIVEKSIKKKEILQRNEQVANKSYFKNSNFVKSIQNSEIGNTDMTKSKPNNKISSQPFNLKDTMLAFNKENYVLNTLKRSNSSTHNDEDNTVASVFLKDKNFSMFTIQSNFILPPLKKKLTPTDKLIYSTTKPAIYATNGWPNKCNTRTVILDELSTVFNNVFKGKGKFTQSHTTEENYLITKPAFIKYTEIPLISYGLNISYYNKQLNSSKQKNKNEANIYLDNNNVTSSSTSQKLKNHTEKSQIQNSEIIMSKIKCTRCDKLEPVEHSKKTVNYETDTNPKIINLNGNKIRNQFKSSNSFIKNITEKYTVFDIGITSKSACTTFFQKRLSDLCKLPKRYKIANASSNNSKILMMKDSNNYLRQPINYTYTNENITDETTFSSTSLSTDNNYAYLMNIFGSQIKSPFKHSVLSKTHNLKHNKTQKNKHDSSSFEIYSSTTIKDMKRIPKTLETPTFNFNVTASSITNSELNTFGHINTVKPFFSQLFTNSINKTTTVINKLISNTRTIKNNMTLKQDAMISGKGTTNFTDYGIFSKALQIYKENDSFTRFEASTLVSTHTNKNSKALTTGIIKTKMTASEKKAVWPINKVVTTVDSLQNNFTSTKYANDSGVEISTQNSSKKTTKTIKNKSTSLTPPVKIESNTLNIILNSPGQTVDKVIKKIKYNTYEPFHYIHEIRDPITKKFSLVHKTTSKVALQSNIQRIYRKEMGKSKKPKNNFRINVKTKHASPLPKLKNENRSQKRRTTQIAKIYPITSRSQKTEEIISTYKPRTILREIKTKLHRADYYPQGNLLEKSFLSYDITTRKPKKLNKRPVIKWKPSYFYYPNYEDISNHDSDIMLINEGGIFKEPTSNYQKTEAVDLHETYRHQSKPKYIKNRINSIKKYLYNSEYSQTTPSIINTFIRGRNNMKYYNSFEDTFNYFNTEYNKYTTTYEPTTRERRTLFFIRPTRAYKRYF